MTSIFRPGAVLACLVGCSGAAALGDQRSPPEPHATAATSAGPHVTSYACASTCTADAADAEYRTYAVNDEGAALQRCATDTYANACGGPRQCACEPAAGGAP